MVTVHLTCKKCRTKHFGSAVKCQLCGHELVSGVTPDGKPAWPKWVKEIARYKRAGDNGVGDTIERLTAKVGARHVKKILKKLKVDCGCDRRQEDWNKLYPYEESNNA